MRDDFGERGLARPGRSPENQRPHIVALDLNAQRLAWADELFLADKFFERARTHAVGQRPRAIGAKARIRNGLKQAHTTILGCFERKRLAGLIGS
jgi:hypothetical protein